MIRPLLIGFVFLTAVMAGRAQNAPANSPLVKARYQVSEKLYAEAVTTLQSFQGAGSEEIRAALTMGQALAGLKKYEESNQWLIRVAGEGTADAAYFMAKNFIAMRDYQSAMQYLGIHLADKNHYAEKVIRMDTAFSNLDNNRDWIHLWQTDWYSSSEQRSAEFDFLISREQLDEALALIKSSQLNEPNDPDSWFCLARIHFLRKEDRQYREALEKASLLASGNLPLLERILRFAMESKDYARANSIASELIRKDPSNPEYLIARALIRILDGKETLALKEISNIEEAGIAPAELYYQAGRKISSSNPIKAESYLSQAIETGSLDARYYCARGLVRSSLDKIDAALSDYAMSLDINPDQPDLYFQRAQVRLNNGDSEGACHDWKMALDKGNGKAADLLYKYCKLP